jgi:F-type H+-transporting ATPase subunit delta
MFRGLTRIGFAAPRATRSFAEAAAASAQLTLNFSTPHTPIHVKKTVDKVILPGAAGEYGVTAGHSPIISELKPGVVQVVHVGVS